VIFLLNKAPDERVGGVPLFLDERGVAPFQFRPISNYGEGVKLVRSRVGALVLYNLNIQFRT
jgi:hypothetical protein